MEQLYPRVKKEKPEFKARWRVEYNLVYEGGSHEFRSFYLTRIGAKISAFMHQHFGSYGGTVILYDTHKEN